VFFSSESFLCDSDAEVAVALASGPLCSVTLMRFLRLAIPCVCDGQSPAREFLGNHERQSGPSRGCDGEFVNGDG
jgi:hypothetical protein